MKYHELLTERIAAKSIPVKVLDDALKSIKSGDVINGFKIMIDSGLIQRPYSCGERISVEQLINDEFYEVRQPQLICMLKAMEGDFFHEGMKIHDIPDAHPIIIMFDMIIAFSFSTSLGGIMDRCVSFNADDYEYIDDDD